MATVTNTIRWADNTDELKRHLTDGTSAIETMKDSIVRTTSEFDSFGGVLRGLVEGLVSELGSAASIATVAIVGIGTAFIAAGKLGWEFAQAAAEIGDKLGDLSDTTGITVPSLDKLRLAATVAGADIKQLTNAVFQMNARMEEGGPKFAAGLDRIGVSFDAFRAMKPDERLMAVAAGFEATTNPSERAAAALGIFGLRGRDMIPLLLDLNKGLEITAGMTPFTQQEADDAESFTMQLAALKLQVSEIGTAIGKVLVPMLTTGLELIREWGPSILTFIGNATGIVPAFTAITNAWNTAANIVAVLRGKSGELDAGMMKLTDTLTAGHDAVVKLGDNGYKPTALAGSDLRHVEDDLTESVKKQITQRNKQEQAIGKVSQSERDLAALMKRIAADQEKATKQEKDLEELFYKQRLKIAKETHDEQDRLLKATNQSVVDGLKQTQDAWSTYYDAVERRTLTAEQYEVTKIWEWNAEQLLAFKGTEAQWDAYYQAVEGVTREKLAAVYAQHHKWVGDTKALLQDLSGGPGGFGDLFIDILAKTGSWSEAAGGLWDAFKTRVIQIFADIASYWVDVALAKMSAGIASWIGAHTGFFSWLGKLFGGGGPGTPAGTGNAGPVPGEGVPGEDSPPVGSGDPSRPPTGGNPPKWMGGIIPDYAALGKVISFRPAFTDTVPAMLTPGEGILSRSDVSALGGPAGFSRLRQALRSGGAGGQLVGFEEYTRRLEKKLDEVNRNLTRQHRRTPERIAIAMAGRR